MKNWWKNDIIIGFGLIIIVVGTILFVVRPAELQSIRELEACQDACKGASMYNFTYGEASGLCPQMNTGQYECCSGDYLKTPSGGLWSNCKHAVDKIAECENLHSLIGKDVNCEELVG